MFTGRLSIIQRVLADYRKPFFESLAALPGLDLSIFAGKPLANEGLETANTLKNARLWNAGNRYYFIPNGYLCWQSGIRKWLREFAPDVLVVDTNPRLLSNKIAIRWMKKQRKPVLGWGLGELPRSGPAWQCWIRKTLAGRMVRSFDGMIAYSSKAAQDYANAGVLQDKIFVAHNAIDNSESEKYLAEFGLCNDWVGPWKNVMGLHPELPIVLFVGRLLAQKKIDLLIKACAPLFPKCQLLIVGDGPAMKDLQAFAKPHERYIKFASHRKGEELAKCYMISDLFVLPGWGGLAVHQAMSYGKPVIASFGDGTERDLVHEGENGFLFYENDEMGLREKITILLEQWEKLSAMGKASLAIIRQEMNLDAMVAAFNNALIQTTNSYLT